MNASYSFKSTLRSWNADGSGWIYVAVPTKYYSEIKQFTPPNTRGFGSIKVQARLGASTWQTSIFPDAQAKRYILFIKKPMRQAENVERGDRITVAVELQFD